MPPKDEGTKRIVIAGCGIGIIALLVYILKTQQAAAPKPPTTATGLSTQQTLEAVLSSLAAPLAGIANIFTQNFVAQYLNPTITIATGGVVQGTQQVGTDASNIVATTEAPGSAAISSSIDSSVESGGATVQSTGEKLTQLNTELAGSGALPVIVYGLAKIIGSGFLGAGVAKQKAILSQQTVAALQMVAGAAPIVGVALGPLVGVLASTKIGTKVVANVGTAEEQLYTQAKKAPGSISAGAVAGAAYGSALPIVGTAIGAAVGALTAAVAGGAFEGGSTHQERVSQFAGDVEDRVAELLQGDTITSQDVVGFQQAKVYGIQFVTVNGKQIDLSKYDFTKVGTNPFGVAPVNTTVSIGSSTYKLYPSMSAAMKDGFGNFFTGTDGKLSVTGPYGSLNVLNPGTVATAFTGAGNPYSQNGILYIGGPAGPIQVNQKNKVS